MGKDFQRPFGIEIECIADSASPSISIRKRIARAISDAGVPCVEIQRSERFLRDRWCIKGDGSLLLDNGIEIVSPPLCGESAFRQIEQVCAALARQGCHINERCGLHVHVDTMSPVVMQIDAMRRLALLYIEHETLLDAIMPPTRRGSQGGNGYCRGFSKSSIGAVMQSKTTKDLICALRPDLSPVLNMEPRALLPFRYVKLNFVSTVRFGTVEFRHHSGTIESLKIINWICACQRMVEYAIHSNDQRLATEVQRVISVVRRGSKRAIIYDMLLRPEGCTKSEVLEATGWEQVSVAGVGHCYGLVVKKVRDRTTLTKEWRYFAEKPLTIASEIQQRTTATTIEEFCNRMQMDDDEVKFWTARAAFFAQPSLAIGAN